MIGLYCIAPAMASSSGKPEEKSGQPLGRFCSLAWEMEWGQVAVAVAVAAASVRMVQVQGALCCGKALTWI